MLTRIGKWGKMLAIRIPAEIVSTMKLKRGELVEFDMSVDGRSLIIRRVKPLTPKEQHR